MNKLYCNTAKQERQEILEKVKQKLLRKLPTTLEETAKEYKVIVRKREIKSAESLLIIMFIYALAAVSQRLLAAFASILNIADISDQAWQKKRQNAKHG